MAGLLNCFERERYSLSATDAQRDNSTLNTVALHRMQKSRREYCSGRTNRMTMRNGTTLDVDNILRQTKVLGDRNGDSGECLIDFDALYICSFPASTFECLFNRGDRTQSEHPRFDGSHTIGERRAIGFRPFFSDQARSATIIADAAVLRPGALPAVIVPSLRNAGFNLESVSMVVSGRLCSSFSKFVGPFREAISIAAISVANFPAACAIENRF